MLTAHDLLRHQQNNLFEDTVLQFMHKVVTEEVLSKTHDKKYLAEWTFKDGSKVFLNNHVFVADVADLL